MTRSKYNEKQDRRGAAAPLIAVLMVPILGMVAFGVDYGYLLTVRSDLQRTADAAALAGAQDLVKTPYTALNVLAARYAVREYVRANLGEGFTVRDSDIEIGKYNPETIYTELSLLDQQPYDTIRVTLRRDGSANSPVSLQFAPVIGVNSANVDVTSTAIIQKSDHLGSGADVLPFAVPAAEWNQMENGDTWYIYGDGKVIDGLGDDVPGNWGTVDIGSESNSTSDIRDQILNGLRQEDIDALYEDGRISSNAEIIVAEPIWLNADTGLSTGMKSAVEAIHGQKRIIPIYDELGGKLNGNNLEFRIVSWGVVKVLDSQWGGANSSYVKVEKRDAYVGSLKPQVNLENSSGLVEGAYTAPALVE